MWCLPKRVRGGEQRRRRDGFHVTVQHCRKPIADRPQNGGVVRPSLPVELVRRTEDFVSLDYGYVSERQPVSAVCRRDGGGGHAMVGKPEVD